MVDTSARSGLTVVGCTYDDYGRVAIASVSLCWHLLSPDSEAGRLRYVGHLLCGEHLALLHDDLRRGLLVNAEVLAIEPILREATS